MDSILTSYQNHKQLFENNSFEAIAIYDENLLCLDINKAFTRIFQYTLDEVINKKPLFLVVPEDQHLIITNSQFNRQDPYEVRLVRKDGSIFTGLVQGESVMINGKKHRVTTCRDISDIKQIQKELELKNKELESMFDELVTLARTDFLTGTSNRRYFFENAAREIDIMLRHPKKISLLMLDIDNFKQVNDTKGHHTGDTALQVFSDVCKGFTRRIDLLGRIGGEEFAIVLPDTDIEDAKIICERLQEKLAEATNAHPTVPPMTVSIGLTEITPQDSIESALIKADNLLYQAKKKGRNRVEY